MTLLYVLEAILFLFCLIIDAYAFKTKQAPKGLLEWLVHILAFIVFFILLRNER